MPKGDDAAMVKMVVDLGQYLGMPVKPSPHLANGEWCFEGDAIVVAHDIWEALDIPVFEMEFLLPDESLQAYEHSTD